MAKIMVLCVFFNRLSWLPWPLSRAAGTSSTCVSSGRLRLPTDALDPDSDPEVTFTATSNSDTQGSLVIGDHVGLVWTFNFF